MTEVKRTVDYAPTKEEAIRLRDLYTSKAKVLGIEGWLIGYEDDPQRGADGRHGFLIYARLPEQREPPDDVIEPARVIPPGQVRSQRHPNRRRHLNRKR